tara:strand:+ start:32115 stop:33089 length:975 start_codon:yes stop_codon:yes gene_type:complete
MNNLIWFKNDLRVQDNTSLFNAMSGENVIGFFCFESIYFEKDQFGFKRTEKFRAKFLIETVTQLRHELKKINIPLFIYVGSSANYLPQLILEQNIGTVYLQKEWTRDEQNILESVKKNVSNTIHFIETFDQFLFHPDDISYNDYDEIPSVFTNFRKKCENQVAIRPLTSIAKIMSSDNLVLNKTDIPTLKDLDLVDFITDKRTAFPFVGGEIAAFERIQNYFWETKKLAFYKKTRNGLVGANYSSKLSAWLANGSISARTIYWEIKKFEDVVTKNQDTYWLIFELIWRDYFKYVSLKHQNQIFQIGGILHKKYDWKDTIQQRNS